MPSIIGENGSAPKQQIYVKHTFLKKQLVAVHHELGRGHSGTANNPTAREWPSSAFFEVVLAVELAYNQRQLADPVSANAEALGG